MKHLFNEEYVLAELKHFLPAQAPLKDFIHHNTLHAFQNLKFYDALRNASGKLGYKVSLTLKEYRDSFKSGRIKKEILENIIRERHGKDQINIWLDNVLNKKYETSIQPKIGLLRNNWKAQYHINLDALDRKSTRLNSSHITN